MTNSSKTLLPLHEGLLTQFIGFTGMYFFDTSATTAGLGEHIVILREINK